MLVDSYKCLLNVSVDVKLVDRKKKTVVNDLFAEFIIS